MPEPEPEELLFPGTEVVTSPGGTMKLKTWHHVQHEQQVPPRVNKWQYGATTSEDDSIAEGDEADAEVQAGVPRQVAAAPAPPPLGGAADLPTPPPTAEREQDRASERERE